MNSGAKYIKIEHPNYAHFGVRIEKSIARKNLNIDESKKVVLFFGLIRNYKGLDVLIDAFSLLSL